MHPEGAVAYDQAVFNWQVDDWSEFAGMPYFGVTTGPEDYRGINGAITQRQAPNLFRSWIGLRETLLARPRRWSQSQLRSNCPVVPQAGVEPATFRLGGGCSIR